MGPDAETAKAPDFNPVAVNQGFAQVVEHDFDGRLNPGGLQIRVLFNEALDEVGSGHVLVAQLPSDLGVSRRLMAHLHRTDILRFVRRLIFLWFLLAPVLQSRLMLRTTREA